MGEAAFELGEAFEGAAAGAAGAGHEDAALVAEEMILGGVAAAQAVEKGLERLGHVGPIYCADPNDAVGIGKGLVDVPEVVRQDAGAGLVAGAPAIGAGAAVLKFLAVEVDLGHFGAGRLKPFDILVFCRCGEAVQVRAGPNNCDFLHVPFPPIRSCFSLSYEVVQVLVFPHQVHGLEVVADGRQEFVDNFAGAEFEARGVDAGVAAEPLVAQHVLVDEEFHGVTGVVHEAHDANGAGLDVEVFEHVVGIGEGKARRVNLRGEFLGLEFLVAWHHEQVECGLLAIAQEQVFAYDHAEHAVYHVAGFHGVSVSVVCALIFHAEAVEEVVGPDFPREPARLIRRPAVLQGARCASPRLRLTCLLGAHGASLLCFHVCVSCSVALQALAKVALQIPSNKSWHLYSLYCFFCCHFEGFCSIRQ